MPRRKRNNDGENANILAGVRAALDEVSWGGLPGSPSMVDAIRAMGKSSNSEALVAARRESHKLLVERAEMSDKARAARRHLIGVARDLEGRKNELLAELRRVSDAQTDVSIALKDVDKIFDPKLTNDEESPW